MITFLGELAELTPQSLAKLAFLSLSKAVKIISPKQRKSQGKISS